MPPVAALLLAALSGGALSSGCAAAPPAVEHPGETADGTPIQRLPRMTVTGYTTDELVAELEQAQEHLEAERYSKAAAGFERVMRLAVDPDVKALAAYRAGLAREGMGQRELALERHATALEVAPAGAPIIKGALVRQTRLLGYLERWRELADSADRLLALPELPVMDRIEALGARGLAHAELGELDRAEVAIAKSYALIEEHRFGQSGVPPVQLAQVAFADGELRRIKSERIRLTPVPPNFAEVLEARCQGLLDAQSAYTEAMRARNAHWSAMSGFRIGQLYQKLHEEAMAIPPPEHASLEQQRLFESAMRLRYRILLEKGLKMMEATVRMGERLGESSHWIERTRKAQAQLEQALADERAALAAGPYTEDELKAALEKLKQRSTP